jgi:hypothetical protein
VTHSSYEKPVVEVVASEDLVEQVGTASCTAVSQTYVSDARLKQNVATIDGALEKCLKLRGVRFDWRPEARRNGAEIGFLAQEVEQVLPECVGTAKSGDKGVAYASMTALLVEAVREQQAEIVALRARVESLQAKVHG